jgi:hypothetical protein
MFRYDGAYVSQAKPTYPTDDLTKAYGYGWFISSYRGKLFVHRAYKPVLKTFKPYISRLLVHLTWIANQ